MATLLLLDGTKVKVTANQAWKIINGDNLSEDQKSFKEKVSSVILNGNKICLHYFEFKNQVQGVDGRGLKHTIKLRYCTQCDLSTPMELIIG